MPAETVVASDGLTDLDLHRVLLFCELLLEVAHLSHDEALLDVSFFFCLRRSSFSSFLSRKLGLERGVKNNSGWRGTNFVNVTTTLIVGITGIAT